MQAEITKILAIEGKPFEYKLVQSKSARKLRVRVGPNGIEVVQPPDRTPAQIDEFLQINQAWISNQLERIARYHSIRKPITRTADQILFRGLTTQVIIEESQQRKRTNLVTFADGMIKIVYAKDSPTLPAQSLENWLRKEAKTAIMQHVNHVAAQIGKTPNCVYIMGQRTKWGNCSSLQNLSFNWRLIMAPDYVLQYLVTHEVVHLEVPDHSKRFWLTVQSLCPEMEYAKQWLAANGERIMRSLL